MFTLSIKDLAGGMTYIKTLEIKNAREQLSIKYEKNVGCITIFDLSTGKELTDDISGISNISRHMECGVYVHSYSKEDCEIFNKYTYPLNGDTIFFFDVYMDYNFNISSIENDLFIIIDKLPELFEWIHDRNVTHFTLETYYITTHEWYRDISNIHEIFENLVRGISDNNTLVHLNISIFYLYLYNYPEKRNKLQEMLNHHATLKKIYLTRHDQRNDKVIVIEKIDSENEVENDE